MIKNVKARVIFLLLACFKSASAMEFMELCSEERPQLTRNVPIEILIKKFWTFGSNRFNQNFLNESGHKIACDICNQSVATKKGLLQHKKVKHDIYYCSICNEYCYCKATFEEHNTKVHNVTSDYICMKCGYKAPDYTISIAHTKSFHGFVSACEKCNELLYSGGAKKQHLKSCFK